MKSSNAIRGLLSGASIFALTWGATSAVRAGTTISGGTTAAVTVTAATDFLWIKDGATVTGNVTNSSTITNTTSTIGDTQTLVTTQLDPGIFGILIQENPVIGGTIRNLGTVDVDFSTGATSASTAWGIGVYSGPDDTDVTVSNSGNVFVSATKTGAVSGAENNIRARGIDIHVTGTTADPSDAVNTLTNTSSGTVQVTASITGVGNTTFPATASATGQHQYAQGENATVSFTNNGTFSVLAIADDPSQFVRAEANGVYQTAIATGLLAEGNGDASASLTNTSLLSIDVTAQAHVSGASGIYGTATVGQGIVQYAQGDGVVDVTLTNSGAINILADVSAVAASGDAHAFASVDEGITQTADGVSATGFPDSTTVNLTNTSSGTIDIRASARATGTSVADADAIIDTGIYQEANDGDDSSVTLTNHGTIDIAAVAFAEAHALGSANANADAVIHYGIYQLAAADGDEDFVSAELTNTSNVTIDILAKATAIATNVADAKAWITQYGIYQEAIEAEVATASIDNSGTMRIRAVADAWGLNATSTAAATGGGSAKASATVNYGIYQYASADDGDVQESGVSLVNSGTLLIEARADATGWDRALAFASIGTGIYQSATYGDASSATLENTSTGVINILADARALSLNLSAIATASISGVGISQTADASDDEESIGITLTNAGTLNIHAIAHATGVTGATAALPGANAKAYINTAIKQTGNSGEVATGTITNTSTGTIDIRAEAYAVAESDLAVAKATIETGIWQEPSGDGADEISETVLIDNSGALNIIAKAKATGASATAQATITNYGIYQSATYGDTAIVELLNTSTGTINIIADAHASATDGNALASATIEEGIDQEAGADGDGPDLLERTTISNDGTLNIHALAWAKAAGSGNTATANAKFFDTTSNSYGIRQDGSSYGDESITEILNTAAGTLSIKADAWASATDGQAIANATVPYGIYQYPDSGDDETLSRATITNSGLLDIRAVAWAKGVSAPATANAASALAHISEYAIYQTADDGDTSIAEITNSATGTLNIVADAWASAPGDRAFASATVSGGIYQIASPNDDYLLASARIDNHGILLIGAYADARGGEYANAVASMSVGISQSAIDALESEAILENTASLDILAIAKAVASSGSAVATATVNYGISQQASADAEDQVSALARIYNSGTLDIQAKATATGTNYAYAYGHIDDQAIYQSATYGDQVTAELINTSTGALSILAQGKALATDGQAQAYAYLSYGISQDADASDDEDFSLTKIENQNNGTIDIRAYAWAKGTSTATATAKISEIGINQNATNGDESTALIDNAGTLNIVAKAWGSATDGKADVYASVEEGIYQYANASDDEELSKVEIINSGSLDILADAFAKGATASASAYLFYGISQNAYSADDALATTYNSGWLGITARAVAHATSSNKAFAYASITQAIYQYVTAGDDQDTATARVTNTSTGTLSILAEAEAIGGTAATASAYVTTGIYQWVDSAETMVASVDNAGTLSIVADAYAEGENAQAFAKATSGITQIQNGPDGDLADPLSARLEVVNSGALTIGAYAEAVAIHGTKTGAAQATASVVGINQDVGDTRPLVSAVAALQNTSTGTLVIEAVAKAVVGASATAGAAVATAVALGVHATGASSEQFDFDVDNAGSLSIRAVASATKGTQHATATGILASAGQIGGTIENSGTFRVFAGNPVGGASAAAKGIDITADIFDGSIVNTGLLSVIAMGSFALTATGIVIRDGGGGTFFPADEEGTITNDGGTLFAGYTHDKGVTFNRGTAIDVENAPNPININLMGTNGDGWIFGNIVLRDDPGNPDTVTVSDGTTLLDGNVNSPGNFRGNLFVRNGGKLILANGAVNGPADAFFEGFTQELGGVIGYQLYASKGVVTAGSINFYDNTPIDGSAEIRPLAGIYPNMFTLEDVVTRDGGTITGTWTGGVTSTSPLLDPTAIFNSDNFDIAVTRVAFGAVSGLTSNQSSVGGGIENVYGPGLEGTDFGDLVGSLFALDGPGYANALDQLGGSSLASGVQIALNSFGTINSTLSQWLLGGPIGGGNGGGNQQQASLGSMNTPEGLIQPAAAVYGMPTEVGGSNGRAVWVRAVGTFGNNDGDGNGPGYDSDTGAIYVGGDVEVDRFADDLPGRLRLGALLGYINTSVDFDNSSKLDYEGVQLGGYGAYERDQHYVIGNLVYGHYWNDTSRAIPLVAATAKGDFDTDLLSLYGEYGQRLALDTGDLPATVIPFLGVSFVNAWSDSFTETGAGVANLSVNSNTGTSFATTLGVRVNGSHTTADGIVVKPEVRLAWEHEFGDSYQKLGASFAAAPGSGFTVKGSNDPRDSLIFGVGLTAMQSEHYTFSFGYDGRFNADVQDHTIHGRVRYNF